MNENTAQHVAVRRESHGWQHLDNAEEGMEHQKAVGIICTDLEIMLPCFPTKLFDLGCRRIKLQ